MYRLHSMPPASSLAQLCALLYRYIVEASEQYAMVQLDVGVRGRLSVLDSSSDPAEMGRFAERFALEQYARAAHFRVVQASALQSELLWGSLHRQVLQGYLGKCLPLCSSGSRQLDPTGPAG